MKDLQDKGWAAMQQMLDREMPHKRKKRLAGWWWPTSIMAVASLCGWLLISNISVGRIDPNTNSPSAGNDPSSLAQVDAPQEPTGTGDVTAAKQTYSSKGPASNAVQKQPSGMSPIEELANLKIVASDPTSVDRQLNPATSADADRQFVGEDAPPMDVVLTNDTRTTALISAPNHTDSELSTSKQKPVEENEYSAEETNREAPVPLNSVHPLTDKTPDMYYEPMTKLTSTIVAKMPKRHRLTSIVLAAGGYSESSFQYYGGYLAPEVRWKLNEKWSLGTGIHLRYRYTQSRYLIDKALVDPLFNDQSGTLTTGNAFNSMEVSEASVNHSSFDVGLFGNFLAHVSPRIRLGANGGVRMNNITKRISVTQVELNNGEQYSVNPNDLKGLTSPSVHLGLLTEYSIGQNGSVVIGWDNQIPFEKQNKLHWEMRLGYSLRLN